MQRRFVIDPNTQLRVEKYQTGAAVAHQKHQRRIVKQFYTGRSGAGRPSKPEIKLLVARLFILWGAYAKTPATLSWKMPYSSPTIFEDFLWDLLPKLGASDVRRYVEDHWKARK
jgi:hypothetical protein